MADLAVLLTDAAVRAAEHRAQAAAGPVAPSPDVVTTVRSALGSLRDEPTEPAQVIDELVAAVRPGLVATTGPRYFGFVIGGAFPAATAADILTTGWDQPAFNAVTSPAAAAVEEVAGG